MNVSEIIAAVDSQDNALPRAALNQAMARPLEVTEPLLDLLRAVVVDPQKTLDPDNNSMGYVIASFLLAQFREPRAYPLLIQMLSLPGVDQDELFGDVLICEMARILASVSGGDTSGIEALIENPQIDARVRRAALESLVCLAYNRLRSRRDMVEYLAGLFTGKLERRPGEIWTDLVQTVSNLGPQELYDDIRKAYEEGLLVGERLGLLMEDVEDNRTWGFEMGAPRMVDCGMHYLIGNTVREIGTWATFSAETRLSFEDFEDFD